MSSSSIIVLNTVAQYCRTLINIILGLYSTRIVLQALGNSDYGIYMLIAGVVGMISFVSNALSITTQRFLSYSRGNRSIPHLRIVFANSLIIHISVCLIILLVLEISGLFLFDGILNIPINRVPAAKIVFQCALLMIALTIITAPFRALLVSHENIVYISIIDVLDGIWKVVIAFLIASSTYDKLIEYAWLTLGINIFTLLCFSMFSFLRYEECVVPQLRHFNKKIFKQLTSFAGWSLYSTGCIVGRNQGIAIVLNWFFGSVINASYGIAVQVNAAVNYIGSALITAFSPRIIMEEGRGNRTAMINYSLILSKVSFLLMTMVGVPIIININYILNIWLGEIPKGAPLLCIVIITSAVMDQITSGLSIANKAIGNIMRYSLFVDSYKIFTIPILFILLRCDVPLHISFWIYAIFELFSALTRFPILMRSVRISMREWIYDVVIRSLVPLGIIVLCYYIGSFFITHIFLFIIEFIAFSLLFTALYYYFSMNKFEKEYVRDIVSKFRR